jgi:tetratricopeptide (TPR) repeat protein
VQSSHPAAQSLTSANHERAPGIRMLCCTLLAWSILSGPACATGIDDDILHLQDEWAVANYKTPAGDTKVRAFDALVQQAATVCAQYPQRAEPLVWEGIILSTYAGAKEGFGALSLAQQARARLEKALQLDANALNGSVYTSLGALYHKVPGFPLGFGDDKKARQYLEKAIALNPDGIDSNYFYGEYLLDTGKHERAREHLQRALGAPARKGREVADAGRRQEVAALLEKLDGKPSRQATR